MSDRAHVFADRREGGRELAALLSQLAPERPIVLALPRGGVPVAYEVARALGAPLDLLLVRKIGAPGNPELGIGAVAEGGVRVLDRGMVARLLISAEELEASLARAQAELAERASRYRGGAGHPDVAGRTVIVVDDGLATGGTASAAVESLRERAAGRVVVAVPVAAPESAARLRALADEVVCVEEPPDLRGVGAWYRDFSQTHDEEVVAGDAAEARERPPASGAVRIPVGGGAAVEADLVVPGGASGLVIFAHGSGSSRHSSRNRHVAELLGRRGLATLLLDLLTPGEELDRANVFDIELLAGRLLDATGWAEAGPATRGLPVGYFGASTGGGAALVAAARAGDAVRAVVSRGGRPDLAGAHLGHVRAPTLLIVGGEDRVVLDLNRRAAAQMRAPCEIAVVPGATHLFEEPGALDEVAQLAGDWLTARLPR
jgi:predicted phosphoribosyltransferase/dienelactone hydrolase